MQLTRDQITHILEDFESGHTMASSFAWSRRRYAPMHIHTPKFQTLKRRLEAAFKGYVIAFDVVFEAEEGVEVDWHCDYESLGPFEYEPSTALAEGHFKSVHFNLTEDGGRLATMPWPWLSRIHHTVISLFGIYSFPHALLNVLSRPLFGLFATSHENLVGCGNPFDNMRLHSVTPGKHRVSYVVRLVREHSGVSVSPESIATLVGPASHALRDALASRVERKVDVGDFDWTGVARQVTGQASEEASRLMEGESSVPKPA